ncbi:MAG: hypothetical protein GKS05_03605 [Nitrospirales bacterium]|nr:hypothetical protein [Nitrospirales bacterium]
MRTFRAVGVSSILKAMWPSSDWEKVLPVQSVSRVSIPGFTFAHVDDLMQQIQSKCSGKHSLYLSPDEWGKSPLASLQKNYPEGAGIKLMKRLGGIDVPYVVEGQSGKVQELVLPSHRQQILTFNFLHRVGLAPQLFDILEIDGGSALCVAYIVEHAPGTVPTSADANQMINALKELVAAKHLQLLNWHGFEGRDFRIPDCNNNLLLNKKGVGVYVDVQNFKLLNYDKHLLETARNAEKFSHFGKSSYLLGGSYLYQSIPGVSLPAKRDPAHRMRTLLSMLKSSGVNLKDRVVLDIGCNLGLMGAQYLKQGALWFHGWDFPEVIIHASHILSSIGCTRFSLTEAQLTPQTDLLNSMPSFLHNHLNNSIISYLAIRKHAGWLAALGSFPWAYMIYEGHEREDQEMSRTHIAEFQRLVPIEILSENKVTDGTSHLRYVALLKRL